MCRRRLCKHQYTAKNCDFCVDFIGQSLLFVFLFENGKKSIYWNKLHFISNLLTFIQDLITAALLDELLDLDEKFIDYKKRGVGKGRTKSGKRKSWKKNDYFEHDLLTLNLDKLGEKEFSNKYAGCSHDDVLYLWSNIRSEVIRPKETEFHARNKLLMWLDKLHNNLSWKKLHRDYKIGISTSIEYVDDLCSGFLKAYEGSSIISFPTESQRLKMVKLNKQKGKKH